MKNIMTWFPVMAVGLLLAIFAIALLRPSEGGGDPIIGQRVSDLDLPLEAVSFAETGYDPQTVEGPYLLNVWASWCPPCRIEHPYLEFMSDQGVPILFDADAALAMLEAAEIGDIARAALTAAVEQARENPELAAEVMTRLESALGQ